MKANNGSGNNKERDEWETPQWLFRILSIQYHFSFDCCANKHNAKCGYPNDFLKTTDMDKISCWMNPPFSNAQIMFEHFFKVVNKGVAIYRCDNFETKIWQDVIFPNATWIFIPNKRIAYEGMKGKGSRFPSALIGLNVPIPKNIKGITFKVRRMKKLRRFEKMLDWLESKNTPLFILVKFYLIIVLLPFLLYWTIKEIRKNT